MDKKGELIPRHMGIIMDGNRRWAKEKGKTTVFGHRAGYQSMIETTKLAKKYGIKYLTFYAFSTENWNRRKKEISSLMALLSKSIDKNFENLDQEGIKIKFIGRLEDLPLDLRIKAISLAKKTEKNNQLVLNVALSYSGRSEIVETIKKMAKAKDLKEITEEEIANNLYTTGQPDPEIIIRCGKRKRLSNFLIWQGAYSEIYFSDKYWPDFGEKEFNEVLTWYQGQVRTFGE